MNTHDARLIQFAIRFLKSNLDDDVIEAMDCPEHHNRVAEIEDRLQEIHDYFGRVQRPARKGNLSP